MFHSLEFSAQVGAIIGGFVGIIILIDFVIKWVRWLNKPKRDGDGVIISGIKLVERISDDEIYWVHSLHRQIYNNEFEGCGYSLCLSIVKRNNNTIIEASFKNSEGFPICNTLNMEEIKRLYKATKNNDKCVILSDKDGQDFRVKGDIEVKWSDTDRTAVRELLYIYLYRRYRLS